MKNTFKRENYQWKLKTTIIAGVGNTHACFQIPIREKPSGRRDGKAFISSWD